MIFKTFIIMTNIFLNNIWAADSIRCAVPARLSECRSFSNGEHLLVVSLQHSSLLKVEKKIEIPFKLYIKNHCAIFGVKKSYLNISQLSSVLYLSPQSLSPAKAKSDFSN